MSIINPSALWLKAQLQHARGRVLFCIFLGFCIALLAIVQAYFISVVLSDYLLGQQSQLQPWILYCLLAAVVSKACLMGWQHRARFQLGQEIKNKIRNEVAEQLMHIGPCPLKEYSAGDLSTTFQEKIEALHPYFSQYYPQSLLGIGVPILILGIIFPLHWMAGAWLLITLLLLPPLMAFVGKKAKRLSQENFLTLSKMGAHFLDCLRGLSTLKQYNQAEAEVHHIRQTADSFRRSIMKVLSRAFLSSTLLEFFSAVSLTTVAVCFGLTLAGQLEWAPTLNFQTACWILLLIPEFYQPMRELARTYHAKADALAAAGVLQGIYALPVSIPKEDSREGYSFSTAPSLALEGVSYTYPQRTEPALKQISLTIQSGEHFALTGDSGAGKSTLMDCLLRFIQPSQGNILVNHISVQEIPVSNWHQNISWISQKTDLLPGTIEENLLLAKPGASEQEIFHALEQAQALSFVKSLPLGLKTNIAEQHLGLSGGQARRIAIARAFLKQAPLLLMDEPTASLDEVTAQEILLALQALRKNKTVVTISHRFETLQYADRIGVLKQGQLIAIGSFKELQQQGLLKNAEVSV